MWARRLGFLESNVQSRGRCVGLPRNDRVCFSVRLCLGEYDRISVERLVVLDSAEVAVRLGVAGSESGSRVERVVAGLDNEILSLLVVVSPVLVTPLLNPVLEALGCDVPDPVVGRIGLVGTLRPDANDGVGVFSSDLC